MSTAQWAVEYTDSTILKSWDSTHPRFITSSDHPWGGEVPYRAIEWSKVARIIFGNAELETSFDFAGIPEGGAVSLRSRHYKTMQQGATMWYIILVSKAGESVTDESTIGALYWSPDVIHHCVHLNCPKINQYSSSMLHRGVATPLTDCTE